ncbi:Proline-, glutamic acid- and leucine-rich protein 1 [Mortierella hygrophila]|uniref:Pre-rRNA-processing protein RIX1 n=1 Tax=Mortierella hygrophila TaxID=979708 RepID=A0A9P6EYM2_9FUNG|nr:Proline-, glutamic acid- and leucine-rich protein 1 [Mortierella hygrophila]
MATIVQATPTNLLDSLIRRYLKDDLTVRDYVPFVLETITHHRLLHDRNDHPDPTTGQQSTQHRIWTQRLRALLESQQPGARFAGVCLVRITAQQSASMFTDHVRSWVTLLVGMLTKHESTANLEAIINTLSELFAKTAKRLDLKSDVTSKYLPDFHNHILNHKDKKDLLPTIYKALTQSVTLFPTTFRLAVDKTEALCVAYMDGRFDMEPEVIKAAATCFAALHAAGGKNPNHPTERITPSEQWRNNVQEVIKAIHRCLNELLTTVDEDKADQTEMAGRNKYLTGMPAPAKDAVERYPQLFARFASLSKVLIACLTCPTKDAVHLPLNSLVALLTRVYNTNAKTPMSDARGIDQQEYFILIAGISSVHLTANEVLKTLLATAQDHLVRHMSHLASIAIKSIRHSSGSSSILRSSTYSVIESFIQAFGIPFVNMVQVPLMAALLEDLRMPSARVVNPLEIGAGGANPNSRANNHTNTTKHKGGAGKNRRGGNTNYANLSALNPLEEIVGAQVFTAALDILSLVLTTSGPNLSPHARAAADTLVVSHLLNSQHHANPIEQSETPFYTTMVRAQLYKALTASVSSPGETQSSLVPLSVGIFKAGLSDPEKFVRDNCTTALTICDLVMHSRMPPMQRARTVAKPLAKGEKPVQEAGTTLFGNFEVAEAKSSAKAAADEDEEEEEESEDENEEEEEEEEGEDVEMEQPKQVDTPSTTASMTAFKAAGAAAKPAATTTTSATSSSTVSAHKEEGANVSSSSIEATKTVSSTSATAAITDKATLTKTTTTTSTTTTLLAKTSSVSTSAPAPTLVAAVTAAAADDLDDDEIPDINMDDDDDDEDMDSD